MASKNFQSDGVAEPCSNCGDKQPHDVSIDIVTESNNEENAAFSREPYRIAECRVCGETEKTRMNNA